MRNAPNAHCPQAPLTRRSFVGNTTAVLGVSALTMPSSVTSLAGMPNSNTPYIDAHSHIWTRDVKRFPLTKGTTVADLDPPSFTTEELLETAHAEGVGRVVLIQHHTYHGFDNSYLIDAAHHHPEVFRIVGMVDDLKSRPDRAMRRLFKDRVTGFRITSWIRRKEWLDGPGMASMWKCAADTRQAICCLIDPEDLTSVDRMCSKYPETPVVIDHFARIGVEKPIQDHQIDQLCRLAEHDQVFLKVSAFYALGAKKPPYFDLIPMIKKVHAAYGPERLMWASDSPYQIVPPHTYRDSIALIRNRLDFLSDSDREWLLYKTAEKVYFSQAIPG